MFLVFRRPPLIFNTLFQKNLQFSPSLLVQRNYASIGLPTPPPVTDVVNDKEGKKPAREWVEAFRKAKLQRSDVDSLSFARSSGPGGQNVNKVNTKSIIRCSIGSSRWIPLWAQSTLRTLPAYVKADDCLLISSTRHRTQAENVEDCLKKLHTLILDASSAAITKDPTAEQKQRVRDLQKAHSGRLKKEKQSRSAVKQGRRGGFDKFD
ncbi:hypothetical protein M407DRAFT_193456 [Tulasnella calospora MUT 4182]|uniref:Prokaryotic-type class I peptide chain release factors domain-containing protein n=1 Tax=Tulasnella calospora MUT 4182 TaxID=1051891 RepID=A0A0C3L0M8_9AGAM|nr:hypothetical protein M407DRAFT_193456 [Tulasnella calospora MUT 4182]